MSSPLPLPVLIIGDGPNEPTGLGRIARDLCQILLDRFGDRIDLVHLGGPDLPVWTAWRHLPMREDERRDDWGAGYARAVYQSLWGDRPGVVWLIWDPARIYPYLQVGFPAQLWGYLAVDASDLTGRLDGVAGEAIRRLDRVVAYGRWGGQILRASGREGAIIPIPHPIDAGMWGRPTLAQEEGRWQALLGKFYRPGRRVIGVVATNQPRKDWAVALQAIRLLKDRGWPVHGWLHTDVLVKAWSLPGLIEGLGLQTAVTVTGWQGEPWTDRDLAIAYAGCTVTFAPGLGEGFGYPIVESLAVGTPVVHVDYGGGRELVPKREWRVPVRELRAEGIYALRRPVMRAEDVANAIERVWKWQAAVGADVAREYCRGAVAGLDRGALQGRWQTWMAEGIEQA